jgi:general nucleoside transport system ATP-binding protein
MMYVHDQGNKPPAVVFSKINKSYGAVHANRDVNVIVKTGSVHGIIGENGAGKSTLMSLLYGLTQPDSGSISINGVVIKIKNTTSAINNGIGMVHQHFMLVDDFTVAENIVLGSEEGILISGTIRRARKKIQLLCSEYGLEVDPDARVSDLPVGMQQRVEILKALYRGARILILDEPTAVLTPAETDQLMAVVKRLRDAGTTVIVITHKLKEIMSMTDMVTVMRQGTVVAEKETQDTTMRELAELMVGRVVQPAEESHDVSNSRPTISERERNPALSTQGLSWKDEQGVFRLRDVSLNVYPGEILGIAGVSGNGQSELLLLLAGMMKPCAGSFSLYEGANRKAYFDAARAADPQVMRQLGVAHVPEDRHKMGMVMDFSAWENSALGYLSDTSIRLGPLLRPQSMQNMCAEMMRDFDVRPPHVTLESSKFSGGNQQKLVMARELRHAPKVLLIGQPTRGVDIGAIELIYTRLREMRDKGCAILVVSTELDEIFALSDRIGVMSGGCLKGVLRRGEATLAEIGSLMGDVSKKSVATEALS